MKIRIWSWTLVLSLIVLVNGCTQDPRPVATQPQPRVNSLSGQDIAPYHDALAAVQSLRRHWLTGRTKDAPRPPAVFVDGVMSNGLGSLAQFEAHQIRFIRFVTGIEATTLYGSQYASGVIMVITAKL